MILSPRLPAISSFFLQINKNCNHYCHHYYLFCLFISFHDISGTLNGGRTVIVGARNVRLDNRLNDTQCVVLRMWLKIVRVFPIFLRHFSV